jgi:hypothetical protein
LNVGERCGQLSLKALAHDLHDHRLLQRLKRSLTVG